MTDQIIQRLKACEDKIRAMRPRSIDCVSLHVSQRGAVVRSFGAAYVPDADAPTIEEALCLFERNVANAVDNHKFLARTIGMEAAE